MLNRLNLFYKKYFFIIKEVYKSDPKVMFMSIISTIISGLSPVLTDFSIAELLKIFEQSIKENVPYNYTLIILWSLIIIFNISINLIVNNIKYSISELAGSKLSHNIENLVAEKFQSIPQEIIDRPEFLDLYKNTSEQSSYAPLEILDNLFNIIASGVGLIGYIVILFRLNVWLVFLLLLFTLPLYSVKHNIQTKLFNFTRNNTSKYREIQYHYDLISNKKYSNEIRLFNLFDYLIIQRKKLFLKLIYEKNKVINKNILYTVGTTSVVATIIGVLEFILIKNVIAKTIFLSKFVLYNTALISLVTGLLSFMEQIVDNNKSMNFLNYLFDFLDYKTECTPAKFYIKNINEPYEFIFDNVSFKYPGAKNLSLKNINLKLKLGDKICLVGENGSGKTTLIKLLLRIYNPTSGKIFLNGIDIKDYSLKDYQSILSADFQEFIHYFFDVKSNIAFGNVTKIDDIECIKKIADKTNLTKFIENYPNGLETKLSKEFYDYGIEPSVGQWQKLSVARAIFRDTPVLILDEPTASLDPNAEEEIFKIFDDLGEEKLVLMISHRMYSTKFADKIVLLNNGELLEIGTHEELMNKKGKYYQLYSLQAKKYEYLK